jgi:hypothetical protein
MKFCITLDEQGKYALVLEMEVNIASACDGVPGKSRMQAERKKVSLSSASSSLIFITTATYPVAARGIFNLELLYIGEYPNEDRPRFMMRGSQLPSNPKECCKSKILQVEASPEGKRVGKSMRIRNKAENLY